MFKLTQAYKMQIDQPIVCHILINKSYLTFPNTFLIDLSSYCRPLTRLNFFITKPICFPHVDTYQELLMVLSIKITMIQFFFYVIISPEYQPENFKTKFTESSYV